MAIQLKDIYNDVEPLTRLSGLPWDHSHGLNIDKHTQPVWDKYIEVFLSGIFSLFC